VMRVDFRHCQVLDPVGDAVAFPKSYGILERPAHFSDLALADRFFRVGSS
jgi:hypothetical protein